MNLFEMSVSNQKNALNVSANTEALEKFAYTELWIERQQTDKKSGSLRCKSAALDGFLHEKGSALLGNEQPKEDTAKVNTMPKYY